MSDHWEEDECKQDVHLLKKQVRTVNGTKTCQPIYINVNVTWLSKLASATWSEHCGEDPASLPLNVSRLEILVNL